jgi:hypothetical protein
VTPTLPRGAGCSSGQRGDVVGGRRALTVPREVVAVLLDRVVERVSKPLRGVVDDHPVADSWSVARAGAHSQKSDRSVMCQPVAASHVPSNFLE